MASNTLLLILVFLLSFALIYSQEPLLLSIRKVTNDTRNVSYNRGTTYISSNNSRCQCIVREGDQSLLQYQDRTDMCLSSNLTDTLDICASLLFNDNLTYTIEPRVASSSNFTYSDIGELCAAVDKVRRDLSVFESLLARTVVCVYLGTCDDKNKCLKAYTNWLCTTQLKLYTSVQTADITGSSEIIMDKDGQTYQRIKPCFGVCRNVLRYCPYYLPSSFQYNYTAYILSKGINGSNHNNMATSYVYGGYPAFACPINTNSTHTYTLSDCIGNNGAIIHSLQIVLIVSVLLVASLIT